MVGGTTSTVEAGKLFTLPAIAGSNFESKHGALSMLSVNDNGKFSGKIVGDKQQLVFDIKQASNFSIDGKKIRLELPDGAAQARCIINYTMTRNGGIELNAKMDFQDSEGCKRIKFDPVSLAKTDTNAMLVTKEQKVKRDLSHSLSGDNIPDALGYLRYKSQKTTTDESQKSHFKASISAQDKPIIENRGDLTTESYSKNTNLTALPSVENSEKLDAAFKESPDSVATEIDAVKSKVIENIGSSRSWDDVTDVADSIALLHGKPTYTKDVRCCMNRTG